MEGVPSIFLRTRWPNSARPAIAIESRSTCHFEEWARAAFASGKYHEAQLTAEIVSAAQRLYSIPERGDRLIAATAIVLDLPLITWDPEIQRAAGVECIW